jgi:hypothetical protein
MNMKRSASLLTVGICAAAFVVISAVTLHATIPPAADSELINRLDALVQHRFRDPAPLTLGMSRVARPVSMGTHFYPKRASSRDFQPESPVEKDVIDALEKQQTQVGFYVIGNVITSLPPSDVTLESFRALKGPAAMTRGTPRPRWYPPSRKTAAVDPNALPDWEAIYPLASTAMKTFQNGGQGFETTFGNWNIAARPVIASQQRCVTCHNSMDLPVKLNDPIGGVLYAYRRPQA